MKAINLNADKVLINSIPLGKYLNDNNTELNNNANLDLSNLSEKGKKAFLPSDTYINLNSGVYESGTAITSSFSFTAPANGYIHAHAVKVTSGNEMVLGISINGLLRAFSISPSNSASGLREFVPIKKGELMKYYITNCKITSDRFIYAEGEI